ncbi:MAG TPA: DinB family protein [Thermoanaerobaculia bacterium]|jgi:uncharacterized damage-inducible protein DinB
MNVEEVRRLFAYDEWANQKMLDAIGKLDRDQFTRHLESSFSSIRETLAHIIGAEWLYVRRWKGESPRAMPDWSIDTTLERLISNLREIERERGDFIAGLTDQSLERPITYRNFRGQEWTYRLSDMFIHVVNHSTYHRGQLTTMMRQAGATPPATDLLLMRDEES